MSTQDKSRELMVKQRQDQEHTQETMLGRSTEALAQESKAEVAETSRERMAEQRQDQQHTQEAMLSRSAAEVGLSGQDADA